MTETEALLARLDAGDSDHQEAARVIRRHIVQWNQNVLETFFVMDDYPAQKARAEAAEAQLAARDEQISDILADQKCGCGYDKPSDVCLGHITHFRKSLAIARAETWDAAADWAATGVLQAKSVRAAERILRAKAKESRG